MKWFTVTLLDGNKEEMGSCRVEAKNEKQAASKARKMEEVRHPDVAGFRIEKEEE